MTATAETLPMKQPALISRAEIHGKALALRTESAEFTYTDLLTRSAILAEVLQDTRSDLNESRVACLLPGGFQYVAAQWAIWRAGGIFVPLSLSATEPELEYTLTDSQSFCVITNRTLGEKLKPLCERSQLQLLIVEDVTVTEIRKGQFPEITADRRAMMLYTSGTTSRPKGVVTTHAAIEAQIQSLITAWEWQGTDTIPLFLPLHHIHGIINILSCSLWAGAVVETFENFDIHSILNRVAAKTYTVFMAVPTIYVKLIEKIRSLPDSERTEIIHGFSSLRLMVSGSAALPVSVHEAWESLTGQRLLERYGMTEVGMALSNPYAGDRRPGTVGQALPGVEIRLMSEQGDRIKSDKQPGEIQIRGPAVFLEYWNRPEMTSSSFIEGWFRTGDMGIIEDRYYRIMGRQSVDIIKSGGYKLSALEIESALLDHPAIRECAVVGIADDTWGELVAAAVVLQQDQTLDLESLRSWCRDRISSYRVPKKLLVMGSLPRNAMGKVTKPEVQKLF